MTVPGYTPRYDAQSPYKLTPLAARYLTYYVHRAIRPNPTDKVFQITDQRYVNRPDLLAFDIYGDADLFWVIPVRNGMEDPIFDLKLNTIVYIPDTSVIRAII